MDDILAGLPVEWVEATARFGSSTPRRPIRAGKLREKLRGRIAKGRPLRERDDWRFEATDRWPGSRTLDDEEAA